MCGNRLKLWNTMPTSARTVASCRPAPNDMTVDHDVTTVMALESVDATG